MKYLVFLSILLASCVKPEKRMGAVLKICPNCVVLARSSPNRSDFKREDFALIDTVRNEIVFLTCDSDLNIRAGARVDISDYCK